MFFTDPTAFANWFNMKVPGAYRKITADDVCIITECGLIGKYGFYIRQDLETVRGILQYEQQKEHQLIQQDKEKNPPVCKICGQPLPVNSQGKPGRHKEYCSKCEFTRNRERQKRLKHRRRKQYLQKSSSVVMFG